MVEGEAWNLTTGEARIAALAAGGYRNDEIAGELDVRPKTVEATLTRVYRKRRPLAYRTRNSAQRGAGSARRDDGA
jgi:DNA-binding NarL/FixJ family response regulator